LPIGSHNRVFVGTRFGPGYASGYPNGHWLDVSVKYLDRCYVGENAMTSPVRQPQAEILSRLYSMKLAQIEQATHQGNSLRNQVLEAEAEAIFNALKSAR